MIIKNNKATLEKGDAVREWTDDQNARMLQVDHVTMEFAYCGDIKLKRKAPINFSCRAFTERLDEETADRYEICGVQAAMEIQQQ